MRLFLLSLSVLFLAGCVTTQSRYDHYQTRYNSYDGTYYAQDRYGHGDYYYQDDRYQRGHYYNYGNYGYPYRYGSLWPSYSYDTPWYSRSMYHYPYRRSGLGVWFNLSSNYNHAWYSPWRYNGYHSGYYSPYAYAYPYASGYYSGYNNGYYYGNRRHRNQDRRRVYDDRYGNAQNEAARIRDDLSATQRRTYNDRSWSSADRQRAYDDRRYDRFQDTNPERGALLDRNNVRGADIGVRDRNNQVRTSTGWHRVDRNDRLPFGMTRSSQRSNLSAADRVRLESIRMRNNMPTNRTPRHSVPSPRSRAATSLRSINQPTQVRRPAPRNNHSSGMFQTQTRSPQPVQQPVQQRPQQRVRLNDMMSRSAPAPRPSFNQPKPRPVQRAVFSQPRPKPAPRPSSSPSSNSGDSSTSRGSLLRRN